MNLMINSIASNVEIHKPLDVDGQGRTAPVLLAKPWADARRHHKDDREIVQIAIIDDRPLISDCFGRGLLAVDPMLDLRYFPDLDAFDSADPEEVGRVSLVLMCISWSHSRLDQHFAQIDRLRAANPSIDLIILSDIPEIGDILQAIEHGVRGYIPTTVSLEVAVKAMRLVAAGGVYIPASVLFWSDRITKQVSQPTKPDTNEKIFTSRQISVVEALRRGKANKIIAYELNMCESTVKVHVRNIMKRLKAKNRTEVAYILNNLANQRNEFGPSQLM